MRSDIGLILLLALVLPSMALSPVEQAYVDGVKEGLKLGQLANNTNQYNIAIQQLNDNLNQTFGTNASMMWLPKKIQSNNTAPIMSFSGTLRPIHKIDGTPAETTVVQY
jgi:hypothetical protein